MDTTFELPDNMRELRIHALQRIETGQNSDTGAPTADAMETNSDPGTVSMMEARPENATSFVLPQPMPALSIALPLPCISQDRNPAASPQRSFTEPLRPMTSAEANDDSERENEGAQRARSLSATVPETHESENEEQTQMSVVPDPIPGEEAQPVPERPESVPPILEEQDATESNTENTGENAHATPTSDDLRLPSTSPAAQRSRRRESRRRSSLLQSNRRDPVLAALSSQAGVGPGILLPSLYGYYSNEPAPSSLRPAAVAYGANTHGAVATVRGDGALSTSSGHMSRMNVGLTERILASGPSVSNLYPIESQVILSPRAESRHQTALLQDAKIQAGSVTFPAGTISDLGPKASEARDAHVSRKFEQNSLLSLSWMIEDVRLLHEEITKGPKSQSGGRKSEAWNLQPLFGDERWRVELVRQRKSQPRSSPTPQRKATASQSPSESEYILALKMTYLELMGLSFTAALPTHVMIGLRPSQKASKQPQPAKQEFLWRDFFSFTFERNNDTLLFARFPDLSQLMANADIRECNAMDLVIQIGTGPSLLPANNLHSHQEQGEMRMPFQTPSLVGIPRSLLQALGALVDDATTGDLMITVCEKGFEQQPSQELAESVGLSHFIQPCPAGVPMPLSEDGELPPVFVRDRVLWAHTSILRERSEIFGAMIESNFSEGALFDTHAHTGRSRDAWRRPYRMLRIPGADYVTMYWLLRYLYTDQVELLSSEDIQAVSLDDAWIFDLEPKTARPDWKWRCIDGLDEWNADAFYPLHKATKPIVSEGHISKDETRDGAKQRGCEGKAPNLSDPHPHPPMLPVPPASPLSLYRLAHRYHVTALCDLITSHIVSVLTPHNATNYLLLTALFQQLQNAIQNYIIHHWQDVSKSEEFEYCFDQVSTGEWGPLAGRALASLMRRLRQHS